jgi:DNA repair exonuclease SbcCD nuclease subunit
VARFIHTADWHLGRLLSSMRLTDDQAFAHELMNQIDGAHFSDAS